MAKTLAVELGDRSYPIFIGADLLSDGELLCPFIKGNQVLIVSNDTVAPLYMDKVRRMCHGLSITEHILKDGERYKTLDSLSGIFDTLMSARHNRTTTVIALGGGVVGDISGFAAACYQRGVNFIQIPTTLLAQVDSSVGGKTGVNHTLGKNMIGAFYQPQCVVIDIDTLKTLPKRELLAGFAEVLKYGLIRDADFWSWLEENYDAVIAGDESAMIYAITRSCENKAEVVAQDEKEMGVRAILNLGHTFGHAIETFQGYQNWLHGEGVGCGMVMAADLSVRAGLLPLKVASRAKQLILSVGLPVAPPTEMQANDFIDLMLRDKKVLDGNLRLVLLEGLGAAFVTQEVQNENLLETLAAGSKLCEES